jgi:signal transduction histidine kinase
VILRTRAVSTVIPGDDQDRHAEDAPHAELGYRPVMDGALAAGFADGGTHRGTSRQPRRADALIAGIVVLLGQIDVWVPGLAIANMVGSRLVDGLGYLACSVALLWRRPFPLAVLAWIVTVSGLQYLTVGASEGLGAFLPLLIAFYSLGRYAETRALVTGGPLAMLGLAVHELRDPVYHFGGSTVTFWVVLAAAWPVGQAFRRRQHAQDALSDRAESLERDREQRARAAVTAERARIARELHDVVGHAVSLVVLQAVAGLGLLDKDDTAQARARLMTIEATARQALAEMRRLLELLDSGEDESGAEEMLRPTPGLGRLRELSGQVKASGLPVELMIDGDLAGLPPGLDLAAYRIVQEALTNALKHAGPARAIVTVCRTGETLEIGVADDGQGGRALDGGGRGLPGMQQRARLYGGELQAGPHPDGGFRVHALLPIAGPAAQDDR